jgi:NAD(P)-dependent dehydrogenase (short-subunit alcohol dehydrogenase family)
MAAAVTKTALVIGGTRSVPPIAPSGRTLQLTPTCSHRGIGRALVSSLLARDYQVYTTIRGTTHSLPPSVHVIPSIDLSIEGASASTLISNLQGVSLDLVLFSAGTFQRDTLTTLSWQDSMSMYATCALAPAFIASALFSSNCYNPKGANFLLLTSEGGSVGLRTKEEGGGNYGHHASKAAANMMGKLLSLDMEKRGINVLSIHVCPSSLVSMDGD